MFDAGNDWLLFAEKVREMGGSTDVQFGSPKNPKIGGRYLSTNESLEDGLQFGDPLEVYASACPKTNEEYGALKERGLLGVKVAITYDTETALLFALAGVRPNDFGAAGHSREVEKRYRALADASIQALRK